MSAGHNIDPSHAEDLERNELDPVKREQEAWDILGYWQSVARLRREEWREHYRRTGVDRADMHRIYIGSLHFATEAEQKWIAAYGRMCEARKEKQQ